MTTEEATPGYDKYLQMSPLYYIQFQHCIYNLISMVDYDCGFTLFGVYVGFCPINKQVVCSSCNMHVPKKYTLSPRACNPRALGVYIRQTTCAHVTTIQYVMYIHTRMCYSVYT